MIQLIGCQKLKFTNNRYKASSRNCIATLQVTARKQRITQIFLHSNSTVLIARDGDAGAAAMGEVGGNNGLCIVFMVKNRISRLCATMCGYTGKIEMPPESFGVISLLKRTSTVVYRKL